MPTRSFPSGAISDAGVVCPNATPVKPTSNVIEKTNCRMRPSYERIVEQLYQHKDDQAGP
jgi:hypothetical protein